MTQKEAAAQFPTATLREDYTVDLKFVLARSLVLVGKPFGSTNLSWPVVMAP